MNTYINTASLIIVKNNCDNYLYFLKNVTNSF